MFQACTSYTAQEIVWGAKFGQNVDKEDKDASVSSIKEEINMKDLINQYRMVETPQMSAKEMAQQGIIDL